MHRTGCDLKLPVRSHLDTVGDIGVGFNDADRLASGHAVDEDITVITAGRNQLIILAQEAGLLDVCLHIAVPCGTSSEDVKPLDAARSNRNGSVST